MTDELPDGEESDVRRRAAWLLVMLALVAALLVTLMVTFFNSSGGDGDRGPNNLAGPTSPIGPSPSSSRSSRTTSAANSTAASSGSESPAPTTSGSSTPKKSRKASCPTEKPCALADDIGDALTAINVYRTKNGKSAVPGSVSEEAKSCALNNGSGCTGGWAETQVAKPDGAAAVQKILKFGKLLTDMKAIEVGWAYDPGAKQYYFAIIRKD